MSRVVAAAGAGNYIARVPEATVVVRARFEPPGVKLLPLLRLPRWQVVEGVFDAGSLEDIQGQVATSLLQAQLLRAVLEHALEGIQAATCLGTELGCDASPAV